MEPASMFGRKKPETEDRKMSDAPDDLGIPTKPARNNSGQNATLAPLGRVPSPSPVPTRPADPPRTAPEPLRPAEAGPRVAAPL
jgi:hypothetical protein